MTWVKICGIANVEDALTAVDAGADALGFVFYEKSPRNVSVATVRDIVRQLPARMEKLGVFVAERLDEMERVAEASGLTGIQMHLRFPHSHGATLDSKTTKYFVLRAKDLLDSPDRFAGLAWYRDVKESIAAIFLDAVTETRPGGTGKTFDWKKAAQTVCVLQPDFRIVVAGGLTATNVAEAMRILKPWGVDVSTGVEAHPGKKDPGKVRAFIAAVRHADQQA
ncbi:MAG: phosphoribosylanthranilate isomerase [Terriglobales bacterium]